MLRSFLLMVILAVSGQLRAQFPLNPEGGTHRCGQCPEQDTEPQRYICGSDGRTYTTCEFEQAKCLGHRVETRYPGRCSAKSCFLQRNQARHQTGMVALDCQPDGSFTPLQCHTGHCWCVDTTGKVIPGSQLPNKRPNCRRFAACTPGDRENFNGNLLGIFLEEAQRFQAGNVTSSKAAEWKFKQLDKNNDYILESKEYRDLKRLVKRLVSPRHCARNFIRCTDKDNNDIITNTEWMISLGVQPAEEDTSEDGLDEEVPLSSLMPVPDEQEEEYPEQDQLEEAQLESDDCQTARQTALEAKEKFANTYVPVCDERGLFKDVQCGSGVCWCVQQKTGKPVQGTAKKGSVVDCSSAKKQAKTLKGCPVKKKKLFARYLIAIFHQQRNPSLSFNETIGGMQNTSVRNDTLYWKFSQLDRNRNNVLEKDEWRHFRKEWKNTQLIGVAKKKQLRRCWRNMVKFCDDNLDKTVSRQEWTECSGASLLHDAPTNARKGLNPFDHILKS